MANWCLATGFPPSEYRQLTLAEHAAFVEVLIERNKAQADEIKKHRKR